MPGIQLPGNIQGDRKIPFCVESWLMQGAIREDDGGFPLGIGNPHDDPADTFPPSFNRFCNHFYDPVHNTKYSLGGCGGNDLTSAPIWALGVQELDAGDPGKIVAPMPMSSPNPNRRNHFTILDAREAMWRALTLKQFKDENGSLLIDGNGALLGLPSPADPNRVFPSVTAVEANAQYRDAYWATTFRALGDVLHLNQDMAQPQHTRIERHPVGEAKYF